jgi:predicted outer membrane protein
MQTIRQAAVGLALALAVPALAQAPRTWPPPSRKPAQAQAPAPAPAPQGQAQGDWLTSEHKAALGAAWSVLQVEGPLGQAAAARAASPDVKALGQRMYADAQKYAAELGGRTQARGTAPANLPSPADHAQLDQEAKQLATRSGDDFDRAFVAFLKQHGEKFVDDFKHARDVIEGGDPGLKKLLDDAEDAQEAYLTGARQLGARQVQARTPPR